MTYYTAMGLTLPGGVTINIPTGTEVTSTGKGGGSLPLPRYRYIVRPKGKKMDAEYMIFKAPPWTDQMLQNATTVRSMAKQLRLRQTSEPWKKRSSRESDVAPGTIVMQRYVPKSWGSAGRQASSAELAANPPAHSYIYREGKKQDADFLKFKSPPWTKELIEEKGNWAQWAQRVGIPQLPGQPWIHRDKSDVPDGYIVFQRYVPRRVGSAEEADILNTQSGGLATTDNPPFAPSRTNKVVMIALAGGAALAVGLLLTKK